MLADIDHLHIDDPHFDQWFPRNRALNFAHMKTFLKHLLTMFTHGSVLCLTPSNGPNSNSIHSPMDNPLKNSKEENSTLSIAIKISEDKTLHSVRTHKAKFLINVI